jgi:hypothetical protein
MISNLLDLYTTYYDISQITIFDWTLSASDYTTPLLQLNYSDFKWTVGQVKVKVMLRPTVTKSVPSNDRDIKCTLFIDVQRSNGQSCSLGNSLSAVRFVAHSVQSLRSSVNRSIHRSHHSVQSWVQSSQLIYSVQFFSTSPLPVQWVINPFGQFSQYIRPSVSSLNPVIQYS